MDSPSAEEKEPWGPLTGANISGGTDLPPPAVARGLTASKQSDVAELVSLVNLKSINTISIFR